MFFRISDRRVSALCLLSLREGSPFPLFSKVLGVPRLLYRRIPDWLRLFLIFLAVLPFLLVVELLETVLFVTGYGSFCFVLNFFFFLEGTLGNNVTPPSRGSLILDLPPSLLCFNRYSLEATLGNFTANPFF